MVKKRIPQKIEKKISDFVAELEKDNLPVKRVILYGSYAKGHPRKWSDIDICIVSPRFSDFFDDLQYLSQKRIDNTLPNLEPIGISSKDFRESSPLVNEIKRYGIEIKI